MHASTQQGRQVGRDVGRAHTPQQRHRFWLASHTNKIVNKIHSIHISIKVLNEKRLTTRRKVKMENYLRGIIKSDFCSREVIVTFSLTVFGAVILSLRRWIRGPRIGKKNLCHQPIKWTPRSRHQPQGPLYRLLFEKKDDNSFDFCQKKSSYFPLFC